MTKQLRKEITLRSKLRNKSNKSRTSENWKFSTVKLFFSNKSKGMNTIVLCGKEKKRFLINILLT